MISSGRVLGVDIGSQQIKVIALERRKNVWHMMGAAVGATPPEAVRDGVVIQRQEVADALRDILREARMAPGEAVAAIGGSTVVVRQIRVPVMSEAMLRKSIHFEAAKYIPSVQDCVVEFEILGKSGDPPQMDVLLVAAPREMVDSRVDALELAGLEPIAIDVESFALMRALSATGLVPATGEPVALVDLGATYTDVNIVHRGGIAVTRSIPVGGQSLTASIRNATGLTEVEADQLKRAVSMVDEEGADGADGAGQPFQTDQIRMARQVAVPFMDEVLRELRRVINFFQSQFPEGATDSAVRGVVLTGGTGRLNGVDNFIHRRLGLPVEVCSLFSTTPVAGVTAGALPPSFFQEHGPALAIAAGLALKE
jgi:type IV pilus assembly protein PilM